MVTNFFPVCSACHGSFKFAPALLIHLLPNASSNFCWDLIFCLKTSQVKRVQMTVYVKYWDTWGIIISCSRYWSWTVRSYGAAPGKVIKVPHSEWLFALTADHTRLTLPPPAAKSKKDEKNTWNLATSSKKPKHADIIFAEESLWT